MPAPIELAVLAFSAVCACIGFFCLAHAYRLASVSTLASWEYTSLLWAGVLGFVFWHEVPSAFSVVGAVLIIASGVYVARSSK